jgi:hypothetical protein
MSFAQYFDFDPRLSWDGLLTFFGGLLAFFAVLYQVRHADRGLQSQLNSEKQMRERREVDERKAVAVALLAEMRFFDKYYLSKAEHSLSGINPKDCVPQGVQLVSLPGNAFPLYHANAYRIGEYGRDIADSLQSFYGPAERFVFLLADWVRARTNLYVALSTVQATNVALIVLGEIKEALPDLRIGMSAAVSALETYLSAAATT